MCVRESLYQKIFLSYFLLCLELSFKSIFNEMNNLYRNFISTYSLCTAGFETGSALMLDVLTCFYATTYLFKKIIRTIFGNPL
jgi:hypothetical protein